jgi:hypothetical protein
MGGVESVLNASSNAKRGEKAVRQHPSSNLFTELHRFSNGMQTLRLRNENKRFRAENSHGEDLHRARFR